MTDRPCLHFTQQPPHYPQHGGWQDTYISGGLLLGDFVAKFISFVSPTMVNTFP